MDEQTKRYWEGVMFGLSVSKVLADSSETSNDGERIVKDDFLNKIDIRYGEIERHIDQSPRAEVPVSGEAEWQSWLIELEHQRWDREVQSWAA